MCTVSAAPTPEEEEGTEEAEGPAPKTMFLRASSGLPASGALVEGTLMSGLASGVTVTGTV